MAACSSFDAAADQADATPAGDAAPDASARCNRRVPFSAPQPVVALRAGVATLGARFTTDERTVYFSSERDNGVSSLDLWTATRADRKQEFERPTLMREVSSQDGDDYPTVSMSGAELYFSRAVPMQVGSYDIWFARRDDKGVFSAPSPLVKTGNAELAPFMASNGDLYYASNETVGKSFEIYRKVRMTPGGPPVFAAEEVVAELSSEHVDTTPVLSDDLLTIYFTSNRADPSGDPDGDVWVAYRDKVTEPFGAPTPVTELVRQGPDVPTWLSPDDCRLYIATKRNGPFEIYVATRTP